MSYSAVEDLIENAIEITIQADGDPKYKIKLIYNLYSIQNMFDTSYTVLRHKEALKKIGYLKEYKLDDLIKKNILNEKNIVLKDNWLNIPSTGINCHYETVDQKVILQIEYKSKIWSLIEKREINELEVINIIDITHDLLSLINNSSEDSFITNWKFFIINSSIEEEFSILDKPDFIKFTENSKVEFIQKVFIKKNKALKKKELLFEKYTYQNIDAHISAEKNLDLNFCLKFFLCDLKQSKTIKEKYLKKIKQNNRPSNISLIPKIVEENSPFRLCYTKEDAERKEFSWVFKSSIKLLRDNDLYILLNTYDYSPGLNCRIGIASPSLAKLQNREIVCKPSSIHFLISLLECLPTEYIKKDKDLNKHKVRKLSPSASKSKVEKVVVQTLEDLSHIESFLSFFDMDLLKQIEREYTYEEALIINDNFVNHPTGIFKITTPHEAIEMDLFYSKCQLLSLYGSLEWLKGNKPNDIIKELELSVAKRISEFKTHNEMQGILEDSVSKLKEGPFMPELQNCIMRSKWD